MTDYRLAKCLDLWAAEFDDAGTPIAWAACRSCPIQAGCRADAKREGTHGVYRGGMAFGDLSGKLVKNRRTGRAERARQQWLYWAQLHADGMPITKIALMVNRDRSTVVHALTKLDREAS